MMQEDTPLHQAARNGHGECVTALLEAGADVEAKNHLGKTPLDCTSDEKILDIFYLHVRKLQFREKIVDTMIAFDKLPLNLVRTIVWMSTEK
jgi:ankyrin repeat protein